MGLVHLERKSGVALGLCNGIFVVYYGQTPTMAGAQVVDVVGTQVFAKVPRLAVLIVIDSEARAPEAEVRQAMQSTIRRFEAKTNAVAYAILAGGFSGAAARGVVTAAQMAVRPRYPVKVFASIAAAVHWLKAYAGSVGVREEAGMLEEIEGFCSTGH